MTVIRDIGTFLTGANRRGATGTSETAVRWQKPLVSISATAAGNPAMALVGRKPALSALGKRRVNVFEASEVGDLTLKPMERGDVCFRVKLDADADLEIHDPRYAEKNYCGPTTNPYTHHGDLNGKRQGLAGPACGDNLEISVGSNAGQWRRPLKAISDATPQLRNPSRWKLRIRPVRDLYLSWWAGRRANKHLSIFESFWDSFSYIANATASISLSAPSTTQTKSRIGRSQHDVHINSGFRFWTFGSRPSPWPFASSCWLFARPQSSWKDPMEISELGHKSPHKPFNSSLLPHTKVSKQMTLVRG
ncbi:hypothetical protein BKA70DRAFT_1238528 [Coprinopsis sp. MPI-PUGE-AT-0042]|nr:hypothetical protein BKA70DRAFT_1238528 [Coprinopsis sp. MPI-PUGE-AT-0042]